MVREANARADAGELKQENVASLTAVLNDFDAIFAVLPDHDAAWYRSRVDYLIVSSSDLSRYSDYLNAGPTVFQISPTPQRWGPPIRIVKLANR